MFLLRCYRYVLQRLRIQISGVCPEKLMFYRRHPQIWTVPAEFSSNPNQTCLRMLIRVFKIVSKSQMSLIRVGAKLCSRLDLQREIWGTLLYRVVNMLYTKPNPKPTDSVNKCRTDIKTYLFMQPCHFNFLTCRFEMLCRTVITLDSNQSSLPPKCVSVLRELPNKLTVNENPLIRGWICAMLTFKHQIF